MKRVCGNHITPLGHRGFYSFLRSSFTWIDRELTMINRVMLHGYLIATRLMTLQKSRT
jgi:hypothetical protein